ncbi:hypothetical protein PIB30_113433, partial [Stylosanthes scabra]|nr:hypothetical protein [Stylosanthes scabra]
KETWKRKNLQQVRGKHGRYLRKRKERTVAVVRGCKATLPVSQPAAERKMSRGEVGKVEQRHYSGRRDQKRLKKMDN